MKRFYRVPTIYVLSKNKDNIIIFHLKINIFIAVKYCCIFHGRVCIMETLLSTFYFQQVGSAFSSEFLWKSMWEFTIIRRTCPCNLYPLACTPLLYSKIGVYRGIHNFIIFVLKHRLCELTIYVLNKNKKHIIIFHLKVNIFIAVKYCCIFHGRVCVMVPLLYTFYFQQVGSSFSSEFLWKSMWEFTSDTQSTIETTYGRESRFFVDSSSSLLLRDRVINL